jgi:hypothetical protein
MKAQLTNLKYLFLFANAVVFAGCAQYIPFTTRLISEYSLSSNDIVNIQFYASQKILLHREIASEGAQVVKGRLIVKNGRSIDEVEVVDHAPGVAAQFDEKANINPADFLYDRLSVRFAADAPTLDFWAHLSGSSTKFYLSSRSDTSGTVYGQVRFGDLDYSAVDDSAKAYLVIDKNALTKLESKRRVLKGLTLPDNK